MLANEDIYVESGHPNPNVNPKIVGAYWINKNDGNCYVCKDNSFNQNIWIKVGDYDRQIEEIKSKFGGYGFKHPIKEPYKKITTLELLMQQGLPTYPDITLDQSIQTRSFYYKLKTPKTESNTFVYCSDTLLYFGEKGMGGKRYYGMVCQELLDPNNINSTRRRLIGYPSRDYLYPDTWYIFTMDNDYFYHDTYFLLEHGFFTIYY